jgi:predicted nucleic-acid-binding protein
LTIAIDTNVLVRLFIDDTPQQTAQARQEVEQADEVILSLPALCELVWVLRTHYRVDRESIAYFIEGLLDQAPFSMDRACVRTGLSLLRAGADFADGVIAEQGRQLGAEIFVSFDRRALTRLKKLGLNARAPAD